MNIDTWAVVVATAIGPIVAVLVSIWIQGRKTANLRRHWVFSTLMGLRGASLNPEHVRALNVVQIEFDDKPKVIAAWRKFIDHLETQPNSDGWNEKHRDLLNDLLVRMGKSLRVSTDEIDVARGGYYPVGWANKEMRADRIDAAKEKLANFFLSSDFDDFVKHMQDADHRAAFVAATEKTNRAPAPLPGGTL
jgi:hypothetical protein